jgi:hypothetical protein
LIVEWYDIAVCWPRENIEYWAVIEYIPGAFAVEIVDYFRGCWRMIGSEDWIDEKELRYWAPIVRPALPPALVVQEARIDAERGRENRHG